MAPVTTAINQLGRQIRVGYVSLLLLIDVVLMALITRDLLEARTLGISLLTAATEAARAPSRSALLVGGGVVLTGLVLLPVSLALYRVRFSRVFATAARLRRFVGGRSVVIDVAHCIVVFAIAASTFVLDAASGLSGPSLIVEGNPRRIVAAQPSLFFPTALSTTALSFVGLSLATPLFWIFRDLFRKEPEPWLKRYFGELQLADLKSALYPVGGRHGRNFNAGGPCPELRGMIRRRAALARQYQIRLTHERGARSFLDEQGTWCTKELGALLLDESARGSYCIALFPSTSRALEVAIRSCPTPRLLLVSPFEHPVEQLLSKEIACDTGMTVVEYQDDPASFITATWEDQRRRLSDWIEAVVSTTSENVALLISDVCWATGLRVPVDELMRDRRLGKISVIVDGAHSLGNGPFKRVAQGSCIDFYVASAHKWLLSPEPVGILAHRLALRCEPYDAWREQVSRCTATISGISALRAAMELGKAYSTDLQNHSSMLREYLERQLSNWEIVGATTGLAQTNMLAIRPAPDRCAWIDQDREFIDRSLNAGGTPAVRANVISVSFDKNPWVRIGLHHYHDAADIDALMKRLDALVLPIARE